MKQLTLNNQVTSCSTLTHEGSLAISIIELGPQCLFSYHKLSLCFLLFIHMSVGFQGPDVSLLLFFSKWVSNMPVVHGFINKKVGGLSTFLLKGHISIL